MTVGELEQRLKLYPRETTVLILATNGEGQHGIRIMPELIGTHMRPDVESSPVSILLVPEQELVKA